MQLLPDDAYFQAIFLLGACPRTASATSKLTWNAGHRDSARLTYPRNLAQAERYDWGSGGSKMTSQTEAAGAHFGWGAPDGIVLLATCTLSLHRQLINKDYPQTRHTGDHLAKGKTKI